MTDGHRIPSGWACINHPPVSPSPSKEGESRSRRSVVVVGQVAQFNGQRNPLRGGDIAKRGGGLASTTPRFHRPPLKRGKSRSRRSVVGQVARFNLTLVSKVVEAYLCRGFCLPPFALSGSTEEPDLHTIIRSFSLCSQEAS